MNRYYEQIMKSKEHLNNIDDQIGKSTKTASFLEEKKSDVTSLTNETNKLNCQRSGRHQSPQIFFPDDKPYSKDENIYMNSSPLIPKLPPRIKENQKPKYTVNTECYISTAHLENMKSSNIQVEESGQNTWTKKMDSNMNPVPSERTKKSANVLQRQPNVDVESPNSEVIYTKDKNVPMETSCNKKINPGRKDSKKILEKNINNGSLIDSDYGEKKEATMQSSSSNESLNSESSIEFHCELFDINNYSITDSIDQDFLAERSRKPHLLPLISITSTDESTNYLSFDNQFSVDSTYCTWDYDVSIEDEADKQNLDPTPVPKKRTSIIPVKMENSNAPDEICVHNSNYEEIGNLKNCKTVSNVSENNRRSIPVPRPRSKKSDFNRNVKSSIYRSCEFINGKRKNSLSLVSNDPNEPTTCQLISTKDSFRNNLIYSKRTCESLNDLTFDSKIRTILYEVPNSASQSINGKTNEDKMNKSSGLKQIIKKIKNYFKPPGKEKKEKPTAKFYT